MRYLLDTHAFIWLVEGPSQFRRVTLARLASPEASLHLSVASCWEMALKIAKGTLKSTLSMTLIPALLAQYKMNLLPIELKHLDRIVHLPVHHKDPFDRLLIAQAMEEKLVVVSNDPAFKHYEVKRLW